MKRKELYNYIREEIVNELSTNEGVAVELTGVTGKTVQSFKDILYAFYHQNSSKKSYNANE
jgi:hypothetical protein